MVGFAFFGEAGIFGGSGFDALGKGFDFGFAADGDFAEFGEASLHGFLLFLGGLFGPAFDGEVGAQFIEHGIEVLFTADDGIGLRLQAAGFIFEGVEAVARGNEFVFEVFAAFGGGAFAMVEFAAFPADVFGFGFEVFDFAGGEAELALQG